MCGCGVQICSFSDVTGATWGGSTVQSDPEEEEEEEDDDAASSSATLPSDIVADITQESNPNNDDITGMQRIRSLIAFILLPLCRSVCSW